VLHEIHRTAKTNVSEILNFASLQQFHEAEGPACTFDLERGFDLAVLEDDFFIIDCNGFALQTREDVCCFSVARLFDEEAWGFGERQHLENEADGEKVLERNREPEV
jgi:hypothetical protein